jgi:hypothetical protein
MTSGQQFHLPPKPRTSPVGLTVGILIILALLVGGGVAIHVLMQEQAKLPAPAKKVGEKPTPQAQAHPPSEPPVKIYSTATTQPSIVKNDHNDDGQKVQIDTTSADWDAVQQTYRTSTPEIGIVALSEFLTNSPSSNYAATAKSQIDEALDRLWWARIKGLCDERDRLAKQMTGIDQEIATVKANGAVAERIAELQGERDPIAKQLADVQGHLDEMKHKDPRVPDLYDEAQLEQLRKARDLDSYEKWKKSTLSYIKRNRGKLPW